MTPNDLNAIYQKWAAINPAMFATCSPRHIQSVFEEAQAQILELVDIVPAQRLGLIDTYPAEPAASASNPSAKLIKLAYSHEFYVCTCAAADNAACTCDQGTLVTTHRNPHLVDPVLVDWLRCQNVPFSIRDAFAPLGLSELAEQSKDHAFFAAVETRKELKKCGCEMSSCGFFIPPSAETLIGLHLRRTVRNQSPTEAPPLSPASLARHLEPSPALHEDHQSTAADPATDPQLPPQLG